MIKIEKIGIIGQGFVGTAVREGLQKYFTTLTYDKNALNLFVETLNTGLVPNTGTDFGPPLKISLEKLKNDDSKPNTNKSKIILLIIII